MLLACAWLTQMKTIHGSLRTSDDAGTPIDAHHHLWDLKRNRYPWLADEPEHHFFLGEYEALKRDYMPEDYLRDSARHNVLQTVHCEAEMDRVDQVGETRWLSNINARYGFPNAIVAHAWFHTDNAEEIVAAQASFPLVRGIRSKAVTMVTARDEAAGAPGHEAGQGLVAGFRPLE